MRPFPLIMCRKLTAFLGLRIGNYSSAAKNAVSALLLGGLAERKRCPPLLPPPFPPSCQSTVGADALGGPPPSCHPDRAAFPLFCHPDRAKRAEGSLNQLAYTRDFSARSLRFLGRNDRGERSPWAPSVEMTKRAPLPPPLHSEDGLGAQPLPPPFSTGNGRKRGAVQAAPPRVLHMLLFCAAHFSPRGKATMMDSKGRRV